MQKNSAKSFIEKMKVDKYFRSEVSQFKTRIEFWVYVGEKGFIFNECDLVKAMASCIEGLDPAS